MQEQIYICKVLKTQISTYDQIFIKISVTVNRNSVMSRYLSFYLTFFILQCFLKLISNFIKQFCKLLFPLKGKEPTSQEQAQLAQIYIKNTRRTSKITWFVLRKQILSPTFVNNPYNNGVILYEMINGFWQKGIRNFRFFQTFNLWDE